jgi:hypothetical protein
VFQQSNGNGLGRIRALASYNGALYVGGWFKRTTNGAASNIARWNGSTWQAVGTGISNPSLHEVFALATHNGDLYITGFFTSAGGVAVNSIAKWNGTSYTALGSGLRFSDGQPGRGLALASFNNELYVTGQFDNAGGVVNTRNIAKWTGTAWASVGDLTGTGGAALTVVDEDGEGPNPAALFLGGAFDHVGGTPGIAALNLARYDGTWSALGDGLNGSVYALAGVDLGGGPQLYASGLSLQETGGNPDSMKRWNGTAWEPVPGGPTSHSESSNDRGSASTLIAADLDGPGPQASVLVMGGTFDSVGATVTPMVAAFNGTSWMSLTQGDGLWAHVGTNTTNFVASGDEDGPGPQPAAVYAFGNFITAGATQAPRGIARRDESGWTAMGGDEVGTVSAVLFFDDGSPWRMHAVSINSAIHRWEGSSWVEIASGYPWGANVNSAAVWDADGSGPNPPEIYVGGTFFDAAENAAAAVVKWDGLSWSIVAGTPEDPFPYRLGYSLHATDEYLYAGAAVSVDGVDEVRVLRWDGLHWTSFGRATHQIYAMITFNGLLYVGGGFFDIDGVASRGLVAWDGASWLEVGGGVTGSLSPTVQSLGVGDDGTGTKLFVGGTFETAGGVPGSRSIAKWDGVAFEPLDGGVIANGVALNVPIFATGGVKGIASLDGSIWVAGMFNRAGSTYSNNIAEWTCPAPPTPGDIDGDGDVDLGDFEILALCLGGPGVVEAPVGCTPADFAASDLDADGDADLADFAFIVVAFSM